MSRDDISPDWIDLEGAVNARAVVPGVLLRSDNLQDLSPRDVETLIGEHGLATVLDLRTDVEVSLEGPGPLTREPTVRIEHYSLHPDSGGNTDLEADTVKPWGVTGDDVFPGEPPVVRSYMNYLTQRPDSIVGAVRAIARGDGATLVHCAAGKDRTGVVVALARDAAGHDRAAIVADYLATADRIEPIFARLVASSTYHDELAGHDAQDHRPRPGVMDRVLELLDEHHGGPAAWLANQGLEAADLARLRERLGQI